MSSAGAELWALVVAEYAGLDPEARKGLGKVIEDRHPWDALPATVRAAFEAWAELFTVPADEPPGM
jgi:hypothetical protein